jgi:uncharacterized protein
VTSIPPPFEHSRRPELPEGLPPERIPKDEPERATGLPAWPPWAPFAAMLITLGIAILGTSIVALIAAAAGVSIDPDDPPAGVTIAGTFIQDGGLIFSALLLARMTAGRPRPQQFGLRAVRVPLALGWLVASWIAFLLFSGIWAAALGIDENDDLPQELGADESTAALVAVAVLVCVAAPIAEELFFRGFCFTALRRWIGVAGGAIATGVIFGLIHLGSAELEFIVPLAVFGTVLCLLYHRTGSLLPCIVLHALNNSLALGVSQKWAAAEVIALMGGAVLAVLLVVLPFTRPAGVPAPA